MIIFNEPFWSFLGTYSTVFSQHSLPLYKTNHWISSLDSKSRAWQMWSPHLRTEAEIMRHRSRPVVHFRARDSWVSRSGITVNGRAKRNILQRPGHHEFYIGNSETFGHGGKQAKWLVRGPKINPIVGTEQGRRNRGKHKRLAGENRSRHSLYRCRE
jgi:hypothetical protein